MKFASDNTAPAHPDVLNALIKANQGYAPSYGDDALMDAVRDEIRTQFEAPDAAVYLVATGTAANVLSLATYCPPWGAIYCHPHAHIEVDECGAPEFYTGGSKLVLIDGPHAKMSPDNLRAAVATDGPVDVHHVQNGMISLTNITELGALYSVQDVHEIAAIARAAGIPLHMDGARFANAVAAAGCTPAEMSWKAGVDVLSFGGTKNGLLGVEAVIMFDPAKALEFELRRKRGGHLFSKHRYLSAQMLAYLKGGLWRELAETANARGAQLARGLRDHPEAEILHAVDANIVFASLPRHLHKRTWDAGADYHLMPNDDAITGPKDEIVGARLVCSWSTTEQDVTDYLNALDA